MSIVYGGPQGPLHDFQVSNALCAATRETNQYVAVHFLDGRQLKPQERPSTMIVVVAAAAWIMDGEIVVSPRHGQEVGADMAGETCPRTEKTHGCESGARESPVPDFSAERHHTNDEQLAISIAR